MTAPRVLLVARPGIGGAARVIEALLRRLPERGVAGTAALSSLEGTALLDVATEHGWDVVRLDLRREIAPFADLSALRRLRRLGRGHDLVHAHAAKAGALARVALGGRMPVVYAPHGFYFTYHPEDSPTYRRYVAIESRLARRTAALHCVSEAEAATARTHGLGGPREPFVLPNPLPAAPSDPEAAREAARRRLEDLGVRPGERVVLMVARLAEPKDPATFVSAMGALDRPDVRGVLVGDGPLLDGLRAATAVRDERVILAGALPDAGELFRAAHAAVLTSASEALPVTLTEAVGAGVPVVATDIPGCREAAGEAGAYVAPGDASGLADALRTLLDEPAEHARRSAAAAAHADRFDEDRWLDGVLALYAAVTGG